MVRTVISTNSKKTYSDRQRALQNRLMNKHVGPVFQSLMADNRHYASVVEEQGIENAIRYCQSIHLNPTIGKVVENLYSDAAKQAYPRTRVQKSVIPLFGFVRDVLQYFRDNILSKVVLPISNTTRLHVERELRTSIQEGRGINETVRALKDEPLTRRRAKTIVRTESVRAMNYAQLLAAGNDKYQVQKTWISVEDRRTRIAHTHAGVDGETRELYLPFSNGLQFPGDPEGDAAQTINCRCSLGYQLIRDLNGRPVLRRPQDWQSEDAFRDIYEKPVATD